MPDVLLACSEPEQAELFTLVAPALLAGGLEAILVGEPDCRPEGVQEWTSATGNAPPAAMIGLLHRLRPGLVVVAGEGALERGVIDAARAASIPTLFVENRLWMRPRPLRKRLRRPRRPRLADAALVLRAPPLPAVDGWATMSERFTAWLTSRGVPSERIVRTGNPRFALPSGPIPGALADVHRRPYTIYAQRQLGLPLKVELALIDAVATYANVAGTALLVALDRMAPREAWEQALATAPHGDRLRLVDDSAVPSLLPRARALLTIGSDHAVRAARLGRPVGLLRCTAVRGELDLSVGALGVDRRRDLEMRMIGLLTDPALRDTLIAELPALVDSETHDADGLALSRLVDRIGDATRGTRA